MKVVEGRIHWSRIRSLGISSYVVIVLIGVGRASSLPVVVDRGSVWVVSLVVRRRAVLIGRIVVLRRVWLVVEVGLRRIRTL